LKLLRDIHAFMKRADSLCRIPAVRNRALPEDVVPFLDLPEPFCFKRVAKGGVPLMVPLPPDGVAAWKLLIQRNGWGHFSQASMKKKLEDRDENRRRGCRPDSGEDRR
jgi:hypothetical protein